ncbi:MAG: hypothetical protein R3A47_02925 [Polyangiales bacterium]
MKSGAMPPGDAGRQVRDNVAFLRPDGSELPSIDTKDGRDRATGWRADAGCGSDCDVADGWRQGTACTSAEAATCLPRRATIPDPNWNSIYESARATMLELPSGADGVEHRAHGARSGDRCHHRARGVAFRGGIVGRRLRRSGHIDRSG